MRGRTIDLNLGHIQIAQVTMQAIGYLATWSYKSAPDVMHDVQQVYSVVRISSVDSSQDISGYFYNEDNESKYFIMAVFDEDTKSYSFHS